jgi:hypothetical protein
VPIKSKIRRLTDYCNVNRACAAAANARHRAVETIIGAATRLSTRTGRREILAKARRLKRAVEREESSVNGRTFRFYPRDREHAP